ncbi:MAG: hypothetical protein ABFD61_08355 [Chloroherpetonaceae bacterium]
MKTQNLLIAILISVILSSCATEHIYYQVYKVAPTEKTTLSLNKNYFVYEDENCIVSYNFWDEGGNIGFIFNNKSHQDIYLNMEESYFIINQIAHNYYKNRTVANSVGVSLSKGGVVSESILRLLNNDKDLINKITEINENGMEISTKRLESYIEEKIICIPSMTAKIIAEYKVNRSFYIDPDLNPYPSKKQIVTKNYTKSNSPFVFSNRLLYTLGKTGNPIKFENEFYISEITNYPENEIVKKSHYYTSRVLIKTFTNSSPDKFYIRYNYINQ